MNAPNRKHSASRKQKMTWMLIGLLAIASFLSWNEYRAHVLGVLPWLLLLACALMHLSHRVHRHRGQGLPEEPDGSSTRRPPAREGA